MPKQPPLQFIVVSALGRDRPGIINDLAEQVLDCGGNILDSRMTVLGGEFAIMMLVQGNWNAIAKLEHLLPGLEKKLDLTIMARRTEEKKPGPAAIPYSVDVVSIDHPGIIYQLAHFFSSRNINIHDLYTDSYHAAQTGTRMFSANLTVSIPGSTHIGRLRDEFFEFCDALNLDAVLEPVKG
ncbi:MAG: glycine cleavage system protein R [Gammaproteobacteria bacterium]|nr:glycine cleavage system protein R [Gammaproteobacteria bacterium]